MAKRIEFERSDVHLVGFMFDRLHAKRGRFERMGDARRWLVIEPASGEPDIKIEMNVGDGDPDAMNLILNVTGVEPGKPAYPELAGRGVTTPSGWILMADVGWVIALAPAQGHDARPGERLRVPRDEGARRRAGRRPLEGLGREARPAPGLHEPEDLTRCQAPCLAPG